MSLSMKATPAGVRFDVRVTPRASRNAVEGVREGRLVVKVTAPPVDAAANEAVVALLSNVLDVPKRAITLATGEHARTKSLIVSGLTMEDLRLRLQDWPERNC